MAIIFLFFLFYSKSAYFNYFWGFIALSVILEAINIAGIKKKFEQCIFILFSYIMYFFPSLPMIEYFFLLTLVIIILKNSNYKEALSRISAAFFLTHYALLLRYGRSIINEKGALFFLSSISLIWFYDIFAFYFGCRFGRHKIAPNISPKKSFEGFFAGIFFSTLASIVLIWYFLNSSLLLAIIMGILAGILGHIGDIFESSWKRKASLKDSSNLIPGHGGIWDRVDGMILLLPAYIFIIKLLS